MDELSQETNVSVCYFGDLVKSATVQATPVYQSWLPKILSLVSHDANDVRQSVAYALGALAEKNPEVMSPVLEDSLTALLQMSSAEDSREEENVLVTQNALSAIGKILQFHSANVHVASHLPTWISFLPPPISEDDDNCEIGVIYKQLCHFTASAGSHLPLVLSALVNAIEDPSLLDEQTRTDIVKEIQRMQSQSPNQMQDALQSLSPQLQGKFPF